MVRVVLDTNVVVSAVFFRGTLRTLLQQAVEREFLPVTSSALLEEFRDVLILKFKQPFNIVETILEDWRKLCDVVESQESLSLSALSNDPADNRVLECAVAGNASAIVTGDRHLLALKSFQSIPILTPQEFISSRKG